MVYLTHIITNYDKLSDVQVFMHAHQYAWHNNERLGFDSANMLRRLNTSHVLRIGYANLRCEWEPGCPSWLNTTIHATQIGKQEEAALPTSLQELFPGRFFPSTFSQPCCAQFAVSRASILRLPRSEYIYYRDWLLKTPLNNYFSGRIWEYLWHFVFLNQSSYCPPPQDCHCALYGNCVRNDTFKTSQPKNEAQFKDT